MPGSFNIVISPSSGPGNSDYDVTVQGEGSRENVPVPFICLRVLAFASCVAGLASTHATAQVLHSEGAPLLLPVRKGALLGYQRPGGDIVIDAAYDEARPFSDGFAAVAHGGMYGLIDSLGRVVVPLQFEWVGDVTDRHAVVACDGRYGMISPNGKELMRPQFSALRPLREGLAAARPAPDLPDAALWGYVDTSGSWVITPQFVAARDFNEGVAVVRKRGVQDAQSREADGNSVDSGDWAVIDTQGRELGVGTFAAEPSRCSAGLIACRIGGEWRFVDRTGHDVLDRAFVRARGFSEGLAAVQVDDAGALRWGAIDRFGRFVLKAVYVRLGDCGEALIPVFIEGKWGYVDRQGRLVVRAEYIYAGGFQGGCARVIHPVEGQGYIDRHAHFTRVEIAPARRRVRFVEDAAVGLTLDDVIRARGQPSAMVEFRAHQGIGMREALDTRLPPARSKALVRELKYGDGDESIQFYWLYERDDGVWEVFSSLDMDPRIRF